MKHPPLIIKSFLAAVLLIMFPVTATGEPPFPVAPSGPTGGSGGLPRGTHSVTIAGQPARIIVGKGYDPAKPTHLAYYLHGDEGGYTYHSQPGGKLRELIDAHSLIYVAPLAPEAPLAPGVFPWDGRSGGSQQGNAAQVRQVLDHMFTHYNVIRDQVLGAGASGGSWFHDMVFFPGNGAMYPSYFNLGCGAGGLRPGGFNYSAAQQLSLSPAVTGRSELKYTIGTADFLYPGAVQSAATYQDLGFSIRTDFMEGVGHCAYDVAGKIVTYWEESLARFASVAAVPLKLTAHYDAAIGVLHLEWSSQPGRIYRVQHSTSLRNDSWEEVASIAGDESSATSFWSEPVAPAPSRGFYRLVVPE